MASDVNLAVQTDALLVELGEGIISEQELREGIRSLMAAEDRTIQLCPESPSTLTQLRSSSQTVSRQLEDPAIEGRTQTIHIGSEVTDVQAA